MFLPWVGRAVLHQNHETLFKQILLGHLLQPGNNGFTYHVLTLIAKASAFQVLSCASRLHSGNTSTRSAGVNLSSTGIPMAARTSLKTMLFVYLKDAALACALQTSENFTADGV
ncbi:hypothetical protein OK016_28075 [Vibrio chagasii]|nr:hypothetical protein [Vibrio chagasii]